MTNGSRKHGDDLRGAGKLALDATEAITDLVEEMHRTIGSGPQILGRPLAGPMAAVSAVVYGPIRAVTRMVGQGIDAALLQLGPYLGQSVPGMEREALLAALNGVLGDYLHERDNPLAIAMRLRAAGGKALPQDAAELRAALPDASSKLLVLVHGSSMSDLQWRRNGHDHGEQLACEHGFTPVYVHYNSGLHISSNGRMLAEQLAALVAAWPVPVSELSFIGHSMGGLVARSACHIAERENMTWRTQVTRLVCLGSPHHGAVLEQGGNWIHALLGVTEYSAPFMRLARIRSAGVTDLRYGNVLDEHWQDRDRFALGADQRSPLPLPSNVACYAVAGTVALAMAPVLPGDGLVSIDSALGRHARRDLTLAFPEAQQSIALCTGHIDLLCAPQVYATLRQWLGST